MLLRRESIYRLCCAALIFWFFQKSLSAEKIADQLARSGEEEAKQCRIRCPLCRWQPKPDDLWYCGDCAYPEYFFEGCGMMWNTFTTKGLCPGCAHQWRYTSCLRCAGWSLHEEWYSEEND